MTFTKLTGQSYLAIKSLEERLTNKMMDCAEVMDVEVAICDFQETEFEFGVILPAHELMLAYWRAADQVVDSYITNERDTLQPEIEREASIARWERMRPSYKRRLQLSRQLCK